MELQKFVQNLADQFDETDPSEIQAGTNFRQLAEYSSLVALSIIAMVDEEYNVRLKGDDIRNSQSVEQLYNLVKERV
jgi:acyl carrier protein